MTCLVTGASGLVGTALVASLRQEGVTVRRLGRNTAAAGRDDVVWDPAAGRLDPSGLEGLDAVVHLAGENIAAGRWTRRRMDAIRGSRVEGTALLARTLAGLSKPPRVLVSASAIGYYGDRGADLLTESSAAGSGFLTDVCREWESAALRVEASGIRCVLLRLGMVLSWRGGAVARMAPAFRMGLGGPLGPGTHYVSWIGIGDLVGVIRHALRTDALSGPVNTVAPEAVTQRAFARALARRLGRPAFLPAPAWALRAAFGRMADEVLLASARVVPERLAQTGYAFLTPTLDQALARPD